MNITIQDDSETLVSATNQAHRFSSAETFETHRSAIVSPVIDSDVIKKIPTLIQKFQPLRFAMGLLSTASGVALILGVGVRVIEMRNIGGDFTMPLIGICVLIGVMLLGGGFGIMATSSSGFDEDEFERLAAAGNISAVCKSVHSDNGVAED
ncbi:MAG: hypothetical protein WKF77_14455 [Planctomycetaceae bacterium]